MAALTTRIRKMVPASRLVTEAKVGVAPGIAFGPAGEGYLRLCFASAPERLSRASSATRPRTSRTP